ncbi:nuclear envelope morphology protein 1 [Magnaporthiopsis poae ATCC 64411]|uniref:Nuclear envelope morphology protein 1 n=1 Tax=Magnaporthiopsis poae (strain ATCC 64411 / 73-15) TaxID=644358 RepID=A0A0C4DSL9_MAGP6|nr:nuclear envelope morphology protein 1 [Magnaporthiopsis poae ATCC 64411]
MNSLNIISARVSPPASPVSSRSNSLSAIGLTVTAADPEPAAPAAPSATRRGSKDVASDLDKPTINPESAPLKGDDTPTFAPAATTNPPLPATAADDDNDNNDDDEEEEEEDDDAEPNEFDPLVPADPAPSTKEMGPRYSSWHRLPRRFACSIIDSLRWVLTTFVSTPSYYLIAWLYDDNGTFAPLLQLRKLFGGGGGGRARKQASDRRVGSSGSKFDEKQGYGTMKGGGGGRRLVSSAYSSSGLSSESESDDRGGGGGLQGRDARGATTTVATGNRSSGSSRHARSKSSSSPSDEISPARKRQPSYINLEPTDKAHQKTLILDLDETLIHSMSKGGRMSSGHMVEVRLNTTYVGMTGQASIGPQHPILYYVHKRPHCDHFLRRVCKWYNLVVFTASVQEYADPVIDWLESERKFFSARYYRQHCTFRHGAFIKDLSSVEPDLSKVMILDNSPLSYMFHQDNAIPIQGWINDPTDNDLLHLVPLLEGLQYVSDVRALLALRGGEDGQHMA